MKINKRLLMKILEEAESPPSDSFFWNIPHIAQVFCERETGEEISLRDAELHAYMCLEAGYIHVPPDDAKDNEGLLRVQKVLRLTLHGYDKLEELKRELQEG